MRAPSPGSGDYDPDSLSKEDERRERMERILRGRRSSSGAQWLWIGACILALLGAAILVYLSRGKPSAQEQEPNSELPGTTPVATEVGTTPREDGGGTAAVTDPGTGPDPQPETPPADARDEAVRNRIDNFFDAVRRDRLIVRGEDGTFTGAVLATSLIPEGDAPINETMLDRLVEGMQERYGIGYDRVEVDSVAFSGNRAEAAVRFLRDVAGGNPDVLLQETQTWIQRDRFWIFDVEHFLRR